MKGFDAIKNFKIAIFFLCSISMVVGILVYALIKPSEAIAIKYFINRSPLLEIRTILTSYEYPKWVLYNLSDFLWAYSYSTFIFGAWIGSKTIESLIWISTIPILTFGYEICQYWNFIPGTFDFLDLTFIFIGVTSSLLTIIILRRVFKIE